MNLNTAAAGQAFLCALGSLAYTYLEGRVDVSHSAPLELWLDWWDVEEPSLVTVQPTNGLRGSVWHLPAEPVSLSLAEDPAIALGMLLERARLG